MKTFLGQLILRLQAEGLNEGKKVLGVMNDIEAKAKRLGATGTKSWGIGFQKSLDRLKASKDDIAAVERSWIQLHQSFKSRNLGKALQGAEISHWRTNTLSHLAQQRAAMDDHFRKVEASARGHGARMEGIMKAVMVSMGFYTAAYGGGLMIRGGLQSASDRSRVDADAYFRGLNENERKRIDDAANKAGTNRRVSITDVKEILADASMNMRGGVDGALQTLDPQVQAFKLFANSPGSSPENAVAQLRAFNKAMDNANVTDPKEYTDFLNNFTKAWQVTGRDIDAQDLALGIKYSRSSGKVFSHDFLSRVLPFIMAETSGSDAGTQLRAMFDQFVVGRAPKNALAAQKEYGLRDKEGRLVGQDEFAQNPMDWAHKYLLPAIVKKGVDPSDTTEVARVIGTLTNNRVSSDALVKFLAGWDQMRNLLDNRFPNAKGLDAANEVDALSMSSAYEGFKTSMANLAAALVPVQSVINPALNSLADGINYLAASAKDNPLATALGIGGAVAGAGAAGKFAYNKLTDAFGLRTAASELIVAAQMLKGAAGADAIGDVPGGKKGGGWWGTLAGLTAAGAGAIFGGSLNAAQSGALMTDSERQRWRYTKSQIAGRLAGGHSAERERDRSGEDYARPTQTIHSTTMGAGSGTIDNMLSGMDRLIDKSGEVNSAMQIDGKVNLDSSPIDAAIAKARTLVTTLQQAATAAKAAANADAAMRRNFSDVGVTP